MALLDFLNTSLVINIGILILLVVLVGGLYTYFTSKLSAQDHKISSMVSCVSTMAEEMQLFRKQINDQCGSPQIINSVHLPSHTLAGGNNVERHLIQVSDDEHDSDDETHDDDDDEGDEDDDDISSDGSSSEDCSDDDHADYDINADNILDDNLEVHETLNIDDNYDITDLDNLSVNEEDNNVKTIHIDEKNEDIMLDNENIDLTKLPIPHIKEEPHSEDNLVSSNSLKTISIIDIDNEDDHDNDDTQDLDQDYKKMNLTKLRDIVVKKKLTNDASKMKKNDILKMLGSE
jgi:hypothetical protein